MKILQWLRLIKIFYIWNRFGLEDLLPFGGKFRVVSALLALNPIRWFVWVDRSLCRGERLCQALQALGPIYVKVGQILSTRQDLLPGDIASCLTQLQDNVAPFDSKIAMAMIESALGQTIDAIYDEFSPEPLASASIAQVHSARLKTGEAVVVKVLRPRVARLIKKDIALMYRVAHLVKRYIKGSRRFHPVKVVRELEFNLLQELDLRREAANACQLKRNAEHLEVIYIPDVYWDYCAPNVMTMERVYGVPILRLEQLQQKNVNMRLLAERGVEIFYTQVFKDRFFHADMHPGNIFVDINDPEDPTYISIDFGIVGTLSEQDQYYLAANMVAFFNRDYHQVARLHVESRWVPADTRIEALESAIRTVCEPIFNKPLKDISFGKTLLGLFKVASAFDMEVQPQLLLLQKTLLNVEGMGRSLYPELDLWATGKPFLERWMKESVGLKGGVQKIKESWPRWGQQLLQMPDLLNQIVKIQAQGFDAKPTVVCHSRSPGFWRGLLTGVGGLLVIGGVSLLLAATWIQKWQAWGGQHSWLVLLLGVAIVLFARQL